MNRAVAAIGAGWIALAAVLGLKRGPVEPSASSSVTGFYSWETGEERRRFHWTGPYASLFVPAETTRVSLPVRLPTNVRGITPIGIEVGTGGVIQSRTLVGSSWTMLDVVLPPVEPPTRFKRINLKVDHAWQPAIYIPGSADVRFVGVQAGEWQLVHR